MSQYLATIVVTKPKFFKQETAIVTSLFENGLDILHVRKPGATAGALKKFLLEIPKPYWNRIVLHSHYALVPKWHLKGIHLTSKVRKKTIQKWYLTRVLGWRYPNMQISTSFHSLHPIYHDRTSYNYVFLSPVFDSISKGGYQSGFSDHSLKAALGQSMQKVVALGGVDTDKIHQIKSLGFYGMAMLGAIWEDADPAKKWLEIRKWMENSAANPENTPAAGKATSYA